MKSKILITAFLLVIIVTNTYAYSNNPNSPATKEVAITGLYHKIRVDKSFQLVLIQSPHKSSVTIAGDQRNIQDVEVSIVDDQLIITSKKKVSNNKIIVYVPAK